MEVEAADSASVLSNRQKYVKPYYDSAKVKLFEQFDYSLIAPATHLSLFLSDETFCVARELFGIGFDHKVRAFAAAYWFPSLLAQLILLPIGVVTFKGKFPGWVTFLTFPGAVFPILLLLRSHWRVTRHMLMQWEPLFLTGYSTVFCVALMDWSGWQIKSLFIPIVVLPTLLSCIFADASSLRLDYAFVKGDISAAALALPPYLVSEAVILTLLYIVTTQSSFLAHSLSAKSVASTTGITISLFIARSIFMLFFDPLRCVSLHAPMRISIATLTPDPQDVEAANKESLANIEAIRSPQNQNSLHRPSPSMLSKSLQVTYVLTGKIKYEGKIRSDTTTTSSLFTKLEDDFLQEGQQIK